MILYTPGNVFANMIVIFKSLILQKFIPRIADESFAKNNGVIFRQIFNTVRPGKILFFSGSFRPYHTLSGLPEAVKTV